jgi:predicted metal-binding protein
MKSNKDTLLAGLRTEATGWNEVILICKKCSKKLSGGFGHGKTEPLRKALRCALKDAGQRGKVGLVPVGCLGVCPKQAVTIAFGTAPDRLFTIPAGCPAEQVLRILG